MARARAAGLSAGLPGLGSWFVPGSVVTDAPLPASTPRRGRLRALQTLPGRLPEAREVPSSEDAASVDVLGLGNTADAGSPLVAAVLERHLGSVDDLLCSQAVWAALRIGRPDLVERSLDLAPPGRLVLNELGRARPGATGPAIGAARPEAAL